MLRALAFLASLLVATLPVAAEPRAVTFGGESYVWAFQDTKPSGQLLVEFVRAGETVASRRSRTIPSRWSRASRA